MSVYGPYILNLFHRSKYVIENGVVNTFENKPDDTLIIDSRLSYNELLGLICVAFGWNLEIVRKLYISLIFVTHGIRHTMKIKNDSHVGIIYLLEPMTSVDLYLDTEDITNQENENNHYGGSFFTQDDHVDEGEQNGPRQEQASISRVHEEDGGSLFPQDDHMDENDSNYVAPSESSEARDPSSSSEVEESDDEELVNEERELNPFFRCHVYKEMGEWNTSSVYKDDLGIKMWDETPKGWVLKFVSSPRQFDVGH
ncbi:OLC1v1015753C1 [Oldenlandia corymbosa var. corymbosa]|uniref:OLC1v1015753C1 n=1 Tax=Oldenlandia corymbosa var. corymbosa TaxID=529605 RepID=A0AAV1E6X3_OLDCO|nr:OLC1v1015753C1 [Oldenlandia corymbosa var. corymbosa]